MKIYIYSFSGLLTGLIQKAYMITVAYVITDNGYTFCNNSLLQKIAKVAAAVQNLYYSI